MKAKKMDPFATKPKKAKAPNYKNFIEAFKDIGKSTVQTFTKDVVAGTVKNAVDTVTKGQTSTPQQKEESFDFEQYLQNQENRIRKQERARFETIRRDEKVLFSREQQQVKIQIQTLQTQIKELANEQVGLMEEADKAAFNAVINPGVYHQNFFNRLLKLIKIAKKKVAESRTWLHMQNHRASSKGYWGGVKKSGTSFMLSGERTVATQSG